MNPISFAINGIAREAQPNSSIKDVITAFDLPKLGVVCAVNGQIVPATEWDNNVVSQGDVISLFQAIAGG